MYQYTALGPKGSNFRLLRLLKGSGPQLECELSPHSLQNLHPPYEALSYTWGSSELVECITLDGKPFWVTDNLHAALQSFRLCDRDRILWIDAICINQEDKVEQSQQVQQMGQIFEKAEKVLFWLGKATPQMIGLMETLSQFRNTDSGGYDKQETSKDWSWKDHSVAIKQIFNREWFTRVWVLQEAAKARRADVCCGTRSVPAEILALAPSLIDQEPPPHCKPVLDIMAESSRSSSWWAQTRDLRTLLRKFQASKATDERDKIYALLGMSLDPLDTKSLAIDYQRPTSQVVHEVMTYLLQSTQTDQSNPFTIHDVLDTLCSFKTLDVTYFVPAPKSGSGRGAPPSVLEYNATGLRQTDAKFPSIPIVKDPTLLLIEDRSTEILENSRTCYSQIVELMLDQQSSKTATDYNRAQQVFSWGNVDHHVKVVVINHKKNAMLNAIRRDCDQVVRLLLHMKVSVEGEEECEAFALRQAVKLGRTGLLQLMIDEGADVNAQYGAHGSVIQAAVIADSRDGGERVKILLDAGADVNAQGGMHGNALQAAIYFGRKEMIKMLLEAGADINAQCGTYGTALQAAINSNSRDGVEIVKILLDAGADVNAQGGMHGSALQAAAASWNREVAVVVVKMLLDAGADVNAQGGKYGNALQAAAANPYKGERLVKMLIDAGADVNAQGGRYGNALQAAAVFLWGESIIEMLLDAGADVNAEGGVYRYALQAAAASYKGEEKVRILLDAGADVNAQGGKYGNALQAASSSRDGDKKVKMLLEAGADAGTNTLDKRPSWSSASTE